MRRPRWKPHRTRRQRRKDKRTRVLWCHRCGIGTRAFLGALRPGVPRPCINCHRPLNQVLRRV